jgi:hypothetical protein
MFADTRRMTRDEFKVAAMKAEGRGNTRCFKLLEELGLPIGAKGEFYCGTGLAGQDGGHFNSSTDNSVVEYNQAPGVGKWGDTKPKATCIGQPGLWCQWNPSDDGTEIVWDGSEKFYNYVEWLEYLIANFLKPWGYKVNGMVEWKGEDSQDIGVIEVVDNVVETHEGKTIKWLESDRSKKVESTIAASKAIVAKATVSSTSEIILDIIKIRNALANRPRAPMEACKQLDRLIAKYEV